MPDEYYITNTVQLTSDEQTDIQHLLKESALFDGYIYDCFIENELICHDNFPCFYQLYSFDHRLICFISLFFDQTELFIYGITHPGYRRQRCFSRLLETVFRSLDKSHAPTVNIFFPINTKARCQALTHYTRSGRICYEYSEYLMKKNLNAPISSMKSGNRKSFLLDLEYEEQASGCEYSLWAKDLYVGGCLIEHLSETEAMIYQFGIVDNEQGKGYGTSGLILICQDLKEKGYSAVSLQVTGKNKKARRLYTDCGFKIKDEIQYFILNKL
ncbi:MAG: GNAT family N-acetyltransferase [Lachnospiraceae bacterium]|nr:GNAT family N-acetyltransferase [Lachnospiraceae bacterium]